MAIPVTSIGAKIGVAAETAKGVRPATGYKPLPMVYSFPELDLTPAAIDTTSYDNEKYKSSIAGLIETSGVQTIEAFYSEALIESWTDVCDASRAGNGIWLSIEIPKIGKAYFIPIAPIEPSMPSVPLNDAVKQKLMFTITGDIQKSAIQE